MYNFIKITLVLFLFQSFPQLSLAQKIEALVQEAVGQNLDLQILEKEYLAALEKAPQVSALPDTEFGIGVFPLPVETRLGPQIARIGATQMLPWKGVLDSKKDLEIAKANTLKERKAVHELALSFQIKKAWLQLYEITHSQRIISRNVDLLKALERLALTKVESGKATGAAVLGVQLKIEELQQELRLLELSKAKPTTTINQLLNRSLAIPLQIQDSLSLAQLPYDKATLLEKISAEHPMIRLYEAQQAVAQQALEVNKLDGKPTIGVGLDYMMVNERSEANPARNGRDIIQLRASLKLPLFKDKYEAKEREEQLHIETLATKKEATVQQYMAVIEQAFTDYEMAQVRLSLYEKQLQLTRSAIAIVEGSYSATGKDFEKLLQLEMELIGYDLKKLKAVVASHLAKCSVEQFFDVAAF